VNGSRERCDRFAGCLARSPEGLITVSVPDLEYTELVVTRILNMTHVREYATSGSEETRTHVFQIGAGGRAAEPHVSVEPNLPGAQPGAGSVHHIAFRIPDADYQAWAERLNHVRMPSSGPVDRFWFRSLYFREPSGILFEIATDGPGFATDEPMDTLCEALTLPPFLEGRRQQIGAGLQPL
jgi:glyoxalase family protein